MRFLVCLSAVFVIFAFKAWASPPEKKIWNESEIVQALGLKPNQSGIGKYFVTDDDLKCGVAVVMTTGSAVRLYESAGDTVATNPSKTAGVKITAAEKRTCFEEAEKLLLKLD